MDAFNKRSRQFPDKYFEQVFSKLSIQYPNGVDPWGLDLQKAQDILRKIWPLYRRYFDTRVHNIQNIPTSGPFMVVSNHSGQIAIDGMLISTAFVTEPENPIILRPMIERFMMGMPFIAKWTLEAGGVLGDRSNCSKLLEKGESVLVFPEGVRGIAKSTQEFYHLKKFTRGFLRIALAQNVPILPIAVVGAEEFYPYVYQARKIAKYLHLPSLPITPLFPWLGPIGVIPLPSPVDIHIGSPYCMPGHLGHNSRDSVLDEQVFVIRDQIQQLLKEGLDHKRSYGENISKIIDDLKKDFL